VLAAPIIGGVGLLNFRQFAVAASWSVGSIVFLRALPVHVAATTPQTTWSLFAVCPDMAELLAIVALREVTLGSVRLHLDHNVAVGSKLKNLLRLLCSREGDEEEGSWWGVDPSDFDRRLVICWTLMVSKPRSTSASEISWAGVLAGRWRMTALMGFSDLEKNVK
jgi:hypothetical protein